MPTSKTTGKKQPSFKTTVATRIEELLKPLHETLKNGIGEKKLDKRIKKAARLIIHGYKENEPKKESKKTPSKKLAKSKSSPLAVKKTAIPKKTKS